MLKYLLMWDRLVDYWLSSSQFFTVDNLKLIVKETKIRSLMVGTLINVLKYFATRSIKTKAAQLEPIIDDDGLGTIVQWDDSDHLILLFNSRLKYYVSFISWQNKSSRFY